MAVYRLPAPELREVHERAGTRGGGRDGNVIKVECTDDCSGHRDETYIGSRTTPDEPLAEETGDLFCDRFGWDAIKPGESMLESVSPA